MKPLSLFLFAIESSISLPASADVTLTVTQTPNGISKFRTGATHTQDSLDPWHDGTAATAAKLLLGDSCAYQNQHIMGFGVGNPWPLSTGPIDWTGLDRRVQLMRDTGAEMVITFCAAPDWMKGGVDGQTDWDLIEVAPLPAYVDDFASLCAAVAQRYPDVTRFQVWNELKGMWGTAPGASATAAGKQRWDYERYTELYNAVYDAVKAVRSDAQIGGPYVKVNTDGTFHSSYSDTVSHDYGYFDLRCFDVIKYWLQNKHGADFITIDAKSGTHDGVWPSTWNDFTAGQKFLDAVNMIRSWDNTTYPGAATLEVWWSEWYATMQTASSDVNLLNAVMASNMIYTVQSLSAKTLIWGPEGGTTGLSNPLGLWTDTDVSGGGQATPYYYTQKGLRDYFSSGTQLWAASSSSSIIGVLAGANKTMLVNRGASAQTVVVNGTSCALSGYEVKFVSAPVNGMIVDIRLAANADDAEEKGGAVDLGSTDLELVTDGSAQTVGLRFEGVAVPRGATITNAYIQFTVDEATSAATSLTIRAQATDDAAPFTTATNNVSSRPRTTASVAWNPVAWSAAGEAGSGQRTPDLRTIIQEVTDRAGWTSSNALGIIITGTGSRVADSRDGSTAAAPLLHIEYMTPDSVIVDVRIAANSDDAEEKGGAVDLGSTDLELVTDGSAQTVGLRFAGVAVPQGATVTNAYIQFTTDEATSGTTNLTIQAQAADNAATFTTATNGISSRSRTSASVAWSPGEWTTAGQADPAQRTPDLKSIIQEVTNRAGWASGNALGIVITGTGSRVADSHEASTPTAPLLHIEYSTGGGDPTDTTPPTVSVTSPTDSAVLTGTVVLTANASDNVGVASVDFQWDGESFGPLDLSAPYSYTWDTTDFPDGTYTLTAVARDSAENQATSTAISVTVDNVPDTGLTADVRVSAGTDDAEEKAGVVTLTSGDLELVTDSSVQTVGIRFTGVPVPQGATINHAYVQFAVDEASSDATSLTLHGQAADNAATFSTTTNDVSARPHTTAAVTWSPGAWTTVDEAGEAQRTPDLKTIIQEIVNRPAWTSNRALAIIVSGTGRRVATAYNGTPAAAPLLHVEYTGGADPVGTALRVPQDYATVSAAVSAAVSGDTILISPGTYSTSIVLSGKRLTLASLFHTTGDPSYIETTIINGGSSSTSGHVIDIQPSAAGSQIIGLTIQGKTHTVAAYGNAVIRSNRILNSGKDGMSIESTGGIIQDNYFSGQGDDSIDIDAPTEDLLVERNTCYQPAQDCIELRNEDYSGTTREIIFRDNTFIGKSSGEDGIQIIDKSLSVTAKHIYRIERNLFTGCRKAAVGLMANSETDQDLAGPQLTERIYVVNNTFDANNYGISGGANLIAVNNVFVNSTGRGISNVSGNSTAAYNLFHGNATNYSGSNVDAATTLTSNPLLATDHTLQTGSPAIDAGTASFSVGGVVVVTVPAYEYNGSAPDLGLYETAP